MMTLTDDQRMLADTVAPFIADEGAIKKQLRHWRDIGCKDGFGHGLWKQFAELGLTGIMIPEAQGGAGLGQVEAGVVLEEIGDLHPSVAKQRMAGRGEIEGFVDHRQDVRGDDAF